jgi:hypothetical protein
MVPRKSHVEYAYECPTIYITNIADRNVTGIVKETLNRVWVPQRKAQIQGRESLPVKFERQVCAASIQPFQDSLWHRTHTAILS